MKILFLNYEYPPLGGGAGVATEAILKEWAKLPDVEVHLVTSAVGETLEHIRVGGEVYVHRLPIGKNPETLHSQSLRDIVVYSWKAWRFAKTFIRDEQKKKPFDVTLAFFTVPCGVIAYFIERRFKIPFTVSLRGADVPGFSEKYDTFYLFAKPLVRFLWKRARAVIPNSQGIRDLALQTKSDQKMEIIENGVDTETFKPGIEPKAESPIVFLSTSRLTPRKGIDRLVEAFAVALQYSTTPLELHLIGEGEQRPMLEGRVKELNIADKVKFLGRIEHSALGKFYNEAHVFVLPSKNEGMSNAALEALASGLPLLVSATGGMEELLTEGKNGLFIEPDDKKSFAEAMVSLANNKESLRSFGIESRRRAEARGWDKVALNFKNLLAESIKK